MAKPTPAVVDRPVRVSGPGGHEKHTTVRMEVWTNEARTRRIWKTLAMWWGASLLALLIPPHFPWFTIAIIGGAVSAWLVSRKGATLQAQQIACPDCGTPGSVEEQPETWPLGVRCSPCGNVFWVQPEESSPQK